MYKKIESHGKNKTNIKPSRLWAKFPTTIRSLVISSHVQAKLAKLATMPGESCGTLIGRVNDDRLIVTSVASYNVIREDKSFSLPISFLFDSINEHRKIYNQDSLLGIFHTHPDGKTALSEVDLAYAKLYNWIWLIVASVPQDTLYEAYSCIDQKVLQISVEL